MKINIESVIFKKLYYILGLIILSHTINCSASMISGVPMPGVPCAPGGISVFLSSMNNRGTASYSCSSLPGGQGYPWGSSLWGAGQTMGGFDYFFQIYGYAPMSGNYSMRLRACPNNVAARCSIARSTQFWDSSRRAYISSGIPFSDNHVDFGGAPAGRLATASNMCVTFVDPNGTEWSGIQGDSIFCTDAPQLPNTPSWCSINNYQSDLNVTLGVLERENIATTPLTTQTVKKAIPINCVRDSATTFNMRFEYTPISISGQSLAVSSTNGLGIAIIYKGKVMSPTDSVTLSYASGNHTLDLEFEAVRDPNMKLADIKTGDFTANAVMIMTEQ